MMMITITRQWQIDKLRTSIAQYQEDKESYKRANAWLALQEDCCEKSELSFLIRQEIRKIDQRITRCERRIADLML